jgi:hypothetical protein
MKRPFRDIRPFGPLFSESKRHNMFDSNIDVPRPNFATHSTSIKNAAYILDEGVIKTTQSAQTEGEVVSLSLGGVFSENKPVSFIFDINSIKSKYNIKPDFYYMVQTVDTSIQEDNYRIIIWDWFTTATEVVSPTNINLDDIESIYIKNTSSNDMHRRMSDITERKGFNVTNKLPDSRLREEFISNAKNELDNSFEHMMFQTQPPSGKIKNMVLGYNNMVANEFDIDIEGVEQRVEDSYLKENQEVWF